MMTRTESTLSSPSPPPPIVSQIRNYVPAPPNHQVLSLLAALSNPHLSNHDRHMAALSARDSTLTSSPESYGNLCLNFARILATPTPDVIPVSEMEAWNSLDPAALTQLRHDPVSGWTHFRQMGGLLLKNALVNPPLPPSGTRMPLPADAAAEIKFLLLKSIVDTNGQVRRVATSTVSSASVGGQVEGSEPLAFRDWSNDLVPYLLYCLQIGVYKNNDPREKSQEERSLLLGALQTVSKLLEDAPVQFEKESGSSFATLVLMLLQILKKNQSMQPLEDEQCKKDALSCLNSVVPSMPPAFIVRMDDYMGVLSALASDRSDEVRRLVCRAIVSLLSHQTEYLQPHITHITEFMLTATTDSDSNVALEACEFWLTFASLDEDACTSAIVSAVRSILPRLVPTLIKGIVYPPDKVEELLELNYYEENSAGGREHAQDMAPIFHKVKTKGGSIIDASAVTDEDDGDDDEDDDDNDDNDDDNEWTIRKCSAASLDTLAGLFGPEDVMPYILPALQECLSHSDPWVREAGVLALGAVAEGCEDAMIQHMGQLHPFLISQLTAADSLPQLKCIAAWTLGRYAHWTVGQVHAGQPDIIGKTTEALMSLILDQNRKVQIAACSAYGVLVESSRDLMVPYLEPVYRTLVRALDLYQTRSLLVLFDTLGTMADYIGAAIGEENLPTIYVPSFIRKWSEIANQNACDKTLLPLMESLASIALVVGMNIQPWALQMFDGAMSIIEGCMITLATIEEGEYADEDADPIVCSADLLDGMVEGLMCNFAVLVSNSSRYGENFLSVLHALTAHEVAGVRMSAFALMGDLARHAPSLIQEGLAELLDEAISCIDPTHPSVCNNAVWAIGEVCVRCEGHPIPFQRKASDLVQNLLSLLTDITGNANGHSTAIPGLAENAATTLGRLAMVSPAFVANDLSRCLGSWCDGMSKISDPVERCDAFQGFLLAVHANPQSINNASLNLASTLQSILFAVVSWHIPPENMTLDLLQGQYLFQPFPSENAELGQKLTDLVHELKQSAGEQIWRAVEEQMPVNVRRLMREVYHI